MVKALRYYPLPTKTSIRLVNLWPSKQHDDQIVCQFRIADLRDNPKYYALSYTWGAPNPAVKIICNEQPIDVTPSLAAALRRLRYEDYQHLLWVDAICINQSDQEERSLQVAMMKEIYDSASHVYIWLGEEEKGVDKRVRHMLEYITFGYRLDVEIFEGKVPFIPPSTELTRSRRLKFDSAGWAALVKFFSHPWFKRIWVMQEAAASTAHMVYYGSEMIDWADVCYSALYLQGANYPTMIPGLGNLTVPTITYLYRRHSLLDLLHLTAHSKASEPRDKIFALLGLSIEGLELDNYPSLKPDYGKSIVEVYADVVHHLVRNPHNGHNSKLGVLSLVQHDIDDMMNSENWFPSWIPRWDKDRPSKSIGFSSSSKAYHASNNEPVQISDVKPKTKLMLRGLCVDMITTVNEFPHFLEKPANRRSAIHVLWTEILSSSKRYPNGDSVLKALAMVMLSGFSDDTILGTSSFDSANISYHLLHALELDIESVTGRSLGTATMSKKTREASEPPPFRFFCGDRLFLITTKGYIGLGPATMQPGDLVCILFGGITPFILRAKDDYYTLVGEAYVYGLMEGEAIREWQSGRLIEEWYLLR